MNKWMIVSLCAGLSSISLAGSVATPLSGIDTQFIDHRARPQDDFYRYVNGLWIDSTSIAPDKERVSPSSLLDDAIKLQLREIIEAALRAPDPADPDGQKIATLYASFLDVAAAERRGLGPLRAELARINGLKTRGELAMTIGRLGQFGVRTPIGNAVLNDPDNPDLQTLFLYQAGLGMPSRDYYLGDEARLRQVRDAYLAHVDRMLGLAGDKDSPHSARVLLAFETRLARAQWDSADSNDPAKTNNRRSVAQLAALAPDLDWTRYLAGAGVSGDPGTLIVQQPGFFTSLAQILNDTPIATWKIYFRYQLLSAYAPFLSRAFVDEGFAFESTALRGIPAAVGTVKGRPPFP